MSRTRRDAAEDMFKIINSDRLTKGQRRRLELVERAIAIVARDGVDALTFDRVAAECHVSRPLVFHYFPDRDAMMTAAFTVVRENYQRWTVPTLKASTDPEEQLEGFLRGNFSWVAARGDHARLWGVFLVTCASHPGFRTLNTSLARIGVRRLTAVIEAGRKTGVFRARKPAVVAKQIQSAIVGAIITITAENLPGQGKAFQGQFVETCLDMARGRPKD